MISIKLIHTLKNKAGISDAEYRAILLQYGGVRSCKDLDEPSYRQITAVLRGMTHQPDDADRGQQKQPKGCKQERFIWALWYQLSPYLPDCDRCELYFVGIIERALGNAKMSLIDGKCIRLDPLSSGQKHKVIESLKKRLDYETQRQNPRPKSSRFQPLPQGADAGTPEKVELNQYGNNLSKNPELANVPF